MLKHHETGLAQPSLLESFQRFPLQRNRQVGVCVSKPIINSVSGDFPPINPSYFDVHQGYKVLTQRQVARRLGKHVLHLQRRR